MRKTFLMILFSTFSAVIFAQGLKNPRDLSSESWGSCNFLVANYDTNTFGKSDITINYVKNLQRDLNDSKNIISGQQKLITDQRKDIDDLKRLASTQQRQLDEQKRSTEDLKGSINELTRKIEDLQRKVK